MLTIQVIPRQGQNAYQLLRYKVIHEAKTWSWKNKSKTRLAHKGNQDGYIEVGSASDVLVARVHAQDPGALYFFAEKFIGRMVAWFRDDLAAINIQFPANGARSPSRRRRRRR
jgi:hypothetical protein